MKRCYIFSAYFILLFTNDLNKYECLIFDRLTLKEGNEKVLAENPNYNVISEFFKKMDSSVTANHEFTTYEDPIPFGADQKDSWNRDLRTIGGQKHSPICRLERKIIHINNDDFEYVPAFYEQVKCKGEYEENYRADVCTSIGFSCVQFNKTIHLTRRKYKSNCWEMKTMVIPAGCECMWPKHKLGDIKFDMQ